MMLLIPLFIDSRHAPLMLSYPDPNQVPTCMISCTVAELHGEEMALQATVRKHWSKCQLRPNRDAHGSLLMTLSFEEQLSSL